MIRAVLFDLDRTLLDLDGDGFLDAYTRALTRYMAPLVDPDRFQQALLSASVAAVAERHPGKSNRQVLWEGLAALLGVPAEHLESRCRAFNRTALERVFPGGAPIPGGREAVLAAKAQGMRVAVATTPIYALEVVRERLRRAQLADVAWDLIATWEFQSTKPHPDYFLEVARRLAVTPDECLMVGDDYFNDLPARKVGMATFYVGPPLKGVDVGEAGSLWDLVRRLEQKTLA